MGSNCSTLETIGSNDYLKRFSSAETLTENDPFWNALLAFSLVDLDLVAMTSSNSKLLDDTIKAHCKNLGINSVKTGNFNTLVTYFVTRLDGVIMHGVDDDSTNPFVWQVLNALFIIRNTCKYFIQHLSEEVIIQQFLKPGRSVDCSGGVDQTIAAFIDALTKGLTEITILETTVLLHLEMVNTLVTLLGIVMYDTDSATNNIFYIEIMEGISAERSTLLSHSLLTTFAHHDKIPSFVYKDEESSSLSSTLWSVMTLGIGGGGQSDFKKVNLGTQSLLLLLVLASHPHTENPYSKALCSFMDEERQYLVKPEILYDAICKDVQSEHTTLLLYKLLHENTMMKAFILSKTDVEKLIEPLLVVLYHQDSEASSHQIYLTLIALLILTEDDGFNKDLFQTTLSSVKWYKDRHLTDITLGDLFILVIIKVMQYNMAHTKDRYLHTNCLAMLANMSSKFIHLQSYVCQRLINFYITLVKRHAKTVERIQICELKNDGEEETEAVKNNLTTGCIPIVDQIPDKKTATLLKHCSPLTDLGAIEEMIRMFLEIMNSCITHTVHLNVHLVHVMLCHQEEFEKFRELESFKPILQNIHMLLQQFHIKLEKEFGEQPRSVSQVLEVIEDGLKTFRRGTFIKHPDLKFKYIEETDSSRFFVPYVWQIVCRASNLHFKQSMLTS